MRNPIFRSSPFGENIRKVAVFGAGKSGIAVAKKLGSGLVFMTEEKRHIPQKDLKSLKKLSIPFELGGHTQRAIEGTDLIVVSPGVHLDIPVLEQARKKNIPIIGEVELAYSFLKKPIIAVTGTNGKTTTTALIGRLLKDHGFRAAVAGNIGFPLISVNDSKLDYIIAEISSYQLETIKYFKPWISIILNITEDHLTRHKSMEKYEKAKAMIFGNQRDHDHLIFNLDDKRVANIARKAECQKHAFSRKRCLSNGVHVKSGFVYSGRTKICGLSEIRIKGEHNVENCLAAISAAMICNVPVRSIRKTLKSFKGVEHRIEFVKRARGVSFYNDSKGTNPDSTIAAIKALYPEHKIVLILGGRDKMTDLAEMCREVKEHVKDVVLIGEAKERILKSLRTSGYKRIHEALSFGDAIKRSYKLAGPGDAVLLSPACASFDMFSNFEERGRVFKKIVAKL